MKHFAKRLKQIKARIGYYGFAYIIDYCLFVTGKRNELKTVVKKEKDFHLLSEKEYIEELKKWYYASTGDRLDLNNPVTFNQKLQWCKVYDNNPLKTVLADKYLVRDWIAKKIGEEYLVPLIGVWEAFEDIDFSILPRKFALKCTHGSGWNIIVEDKKTLNIQDVQNKITRWMSENYAYKAGFELHYKNIVPRIIAEEYMENSSGEIFDYKFYCFDGKVQYIQFLMGRKKELKMAYFDRQWKKQTFRNNHKLIEENIEKPDNLAKMIELAEILAAGFPYVRVDFYRLNDGTIKFGEMTFTPASGTQDWIPDTTNYKLGEMLKLPLANTNDRR